MVVFVLVIYAEYVLFLAVSTDTLLLVVSRYLGVFRVEWLEEF